MGQGLSYLDTPITLIIALLTVIISWLAFNNSRIRNMLLMNPYSVKHRNEYYRVFGHALIHADFMHLFFNMYVFFEFGRILEAVMTVESFYTSIIPDEPFWGVWTGRLFFITLYTGGVMFASLPAMRKHADNPSYNSLGASGAVSAVLMGFIVLFPVAELSLLIFPFFGIPAFIMGILFFVYESYMNRRGRTNIAHDAHLVGAAFGLVFMLIVNPGFLTRLIAELSAYFG